ncbi:MAG: M14 family metallopeptidase [Pyrinomonadaceae bacterium]
MFAFSASLRLCGLILLSTLAAFTQTIPSPKDVLDWTPGDDRKLASWSQTVDYFKKLDAASDRVNFQEIGKTTMGVPFVYATISSPENLKQLKKYEDINAKLADPRKIGGTRTSLSARDTAAKKLIAEGKTIVLITCGIHSTEVGSHTSSFLIAHRLASSNEPEILNILKNTIVLLVPSLNPDGVDIVKNWYDKTLGTPYEGTTPPELYHKYVGHDNNRDWYAFTQVETQLTVDKIHNVWHPQIVHDIHQQGANGSRLFLPPYMDPVEPNVPKKIVEGYTELGNAMAADLRSKGFQGITTNSTYDAWTPARAYSHYHGGVRILSETASARLASPITIQENQIRGGLGYDAKKESPNFGPVWKGGEWKIRDITNYVTGAAFSLLNHAANNREKWLSRFYEIGKEAVRPRTKAGELYGFRVKIDDNFPRLLELLDRAGVQHGFPIGEKKSDVGYTTYHGGSVSYPSKSIIIPLEQPYGSFAKALLERQTYPDLKDDKGNPITPYDVTAHTLPLLMNLSVEEIRSPFRPKWIKNVRIRNGIGDCQLGVSNKIGLYKSSMASMDEGWTRWIFKDAPCMENEPVKDVDIRSSRFAQKVPPFSGMVTSVSAKLLNPDYKTIIFPDQPANQILNGYAKGSMPDEYLGGVGKEGVANLKKFVEDGGTLVFLNNSCDFAIEQFNLPIRDVTKGLPRKDFFIPGSILRTELDTTHPIANGMPKESIAWFEDSPAFEVGSPGFSRPDATEKPPEGGTPNVRIIARYPSDPKSILLSGWALGAEIIAGKAALVEVKMGKGKIILFGFRPQYRGQSLATYPLLFNAISN